MKHTFTASAIMDELLSSCAEGFAIPSPGELIDGVIVNISKNKILVDLGGTATGVIYGQEAIDSMGTAKKLKEGDIVTSYVLDDENDDGLVVLSLRKASQRKTWENFIDSYEEGKVIEVVPNEANKGGLLLNIDGIKGFIPVSQLAPLHYPRVNGANANEILARLQKLIGVSLKVKILSLDREGGKLILSEKAAETEQRDEAMEKLEVGQKLIGKVSGIVNFGIFVTFNGLEGLVHISEIAWGHVRDPNDFGKIGDEVEVLVIGKEKEKISLSMKKLIPDPWIEAAKKYKVGTIIESEVSRITPFGAFVKLDNDINGLVHVSEVAEEEGAKIEDVLSVGDKITAKIISIDPEEHRVGLSVKALSEDSSAEKENVGDEDGEAKVVKKSKKTEKTANKSAKKKKGTGKDKEAGETLDAYSAAA